MAVLGGWFREMAHAEALSAVDRVAEALGTTRLVEWPEVHACPRRRFRDHRAESGTAPARPEASAQRLRAPTRATASWPMR
jgi:hypothetical protein